MKSKKETSAKKAAKLPVKGAAKEYTFFQDVFDVVRQIPKGRVTSYGAIAACLGTKLSARMVGWAMNGAHRVRPKVPAHRVAPAPQHVRRDAVQLGTRRDPPHVSQAG